MSSAHGGDAGKRQAERQVAAAANDVSFGQLGVWRLDSYAAADGSIDRRRE
jgi:hypothetical protein